MVGSAIASGTATRSVVTTVVLALLATFYAGRLLAKGGHGGLGFAGALICLFFYLIPFFGYGFTATRCLLQQVTRQLPIWTLPALLIVPYLVYGLTTQTFAWLSVVQLLLFCALPIGFSTIGAAYPSLRIATTVLAIACIWLPFDFDLVTHLWPWPKGNGAYVINVILAVDLALICFVTINRDEEIGYKFDFDQNIVVETIKNLALFMAVGIPLAFAIDFIAFAPKFTGMVSFLETCLGIFLTIALPEELLFRGVLQTQFTRWFKNGMAALVLASLVFGLAHLNNGPPLPNYSFFVLASLAGLFYGMAFRRTGGLMAPALIHTLVDALWVTFFRI